MHTFYLLFATLLVATLPLNLSFAITGGKSYADVEPQRIESSFEGLTSSQIIETPVRELDEVLGRKLTRAEKATARKVKRLNRLFQGPNKPKKPKRPTKTDPTAIVAFATGVGGLVMLVVGLGVLGIPSCIVAIVFGAISLNKFKIGSNRGGGRGLALAGMICGIVGVAAILALIALLFAAFGGW